jgi:hypothetical protein
MFTLKIDDGICKGFKNFDDIDFFVNKCFDEDNNQHGLLIWIPTIPSHGISMIQQPLFYESEAERDRIYTENINDEFANLYWANLIAHIENQKNQ